MKKILLVDSISFCRELFSLALRNIGYEIEMACDGVQALDIVKNNKPDLIIMDAELPNMDGITVLRVLRSVPAFRNIPVFMLTTIEDRTHIRLASQIGIQAYVLKSQFALETMLMRIEKHIGPPAKRAGKGPSIVEIHEPLMPGKGSAKIEVPEIEGEIAADFV